ncbi:carboxypeptidase regulatory-like domain-containing protein, partial [Persephonella sp.]
MIFREFSEKSYTLQKNFFILMIISFIISGCGGSGGTSDNNNSSNTTPDLINTNPDSDTPGSIRFKIKDIEVRSLEKLGNVIVSEGDLIATPDKIKFAIENATGGTGEKLENINIHDDGTVEIKDVPPSSNISLTINTGEKGVNLNNIAVRGGSSTDLGEISLSNLYTLSFLVKTSEHEEVILNIPELNIKNKIIKANQIEEILNVPEGKYLCSISDLNGNVLFFKYLDVNDNSNIEITLDDFLHLGILRGTVTDASNNPLEKALVYLRPTKGDLILALTDSRGFFEIKNLTKGRYTLIIEKDGYIPVEIDVDLNDLDLDLGRIQLNSASGKGSIIGHVYLSGETDNSGTVIGYEMIGDNNLETKAYTTRTDGTFVIKNLPDGKYVLTITPVRDYFIPKKINVEVVSGKVTVIADPIEIDRQVATIKGVLKIATGINSSDLNDIRIEVLSSDDSLLAALSLTEIRADDEGNFEFVINDIPVGFDSYTVKLSGKDKYGNQIAVKTVIIDSLEPEELYVLESPLVIEYIDPNPPEIVLLNVINIDSTTVFDTDLGGYILNPGERINIEVLAQDPDGDEITYLFNATDGEWLAIKEDTGKATFKAPDTGGNYNLTITARSGSREDVANVLLIVNHHPEIVVLSPSESELTESNPKEFKPNEEVVINTNITDFEDPTDNLQIKWYSDLQGLIAENTPVLKKVLIPGTHKITLTVTDSKGLTSRKEFYVEVLPLDIVWLKEPDITQMKLYFTSEGISLNSEYQIPQGTVDKNLLYETLDSSVATVSSDGLVTAVKSGTTTIRIYSAEQDVDGNPLYEYKLTVRVIGDLNNESVKSLGIGQIKQLRLNSSMITDTDGDGCLTDEYYSVTLDFPYNGRYEILVFDQKEVIAKSYVNRWIHVNNSPAESTYSEGTVGSHQIEVIDSNSNYELRLYPHVENHYTCGDFDLYFKIGIFPSPEITNIYPEASKYVAWDGNYEPNNVDSTAFSINLGKAVISEINILNYDTEDWFILEDLSPGVYTIIFEVESGTDSSWGDLYIEIYDPSGAKIASQYMYSPSDGKWLTFTFDAKQTGDYKIRLYRKNNLDTYYKFIVYPSVENGLVH